MIIRPVTENDRDLIAGWIANEPAHKASSPDYYFEPNTKSVIYEDDDGGILVAKFTPVIRLDLDFNPNAGKMRIAKTMLREVPDLAKQAESQGFHEFVFDSKSPDLIKFCQKLGFEAVTDYRKVF